MKLIQKKEMYIAICTFQEKDTPKSAGFKWNPADKCWWTDKPELAYKLIEYSDFGCKTSLENWKSQSKIKIEASKASDIDKDFPHPENLNYRPFQKAGINFALENQNTLIGDDMGLGKTIQAIGVINSDINIQKILVICPASLKLNWKIEIEKWQTRNLSIQIGNGIFPNSNIIILNYDILHKFKKEIDLVKWDLLIVDECHYAKNPKSRRTKMLIGHKKEEIEPIKANKKIFMTGTPIVNRPIELWPIVSFLNPKIFNSFWDFAKRYCNAKQDKYGWNLSGASNLDELQNKLRSSIMIRRLKKDVLKELPAKIRQIVTLPSNGCSSAIKEEQKAYSNYESKLIELKEKVKLAKTENKESYNEAVKNLKQASSIAFGEIAKARHKVAVAKAPYVAEQIKEIIEEDANKKIVIFTHHHDVVDLFMQEFGNKAVKLTGQESSEQKQRAVEDFQNKSSIQIFVGSITAAGVGITLTAASHVIFAELDWVPGNITQAEDRCHRIGQENSVLIQHVVLDGSLDSKLAKTLIEKQEVIEKALDNNEELEIPIV